MDNLLLGGVVAVAFGIVVLVFLRPILLWYWKIDTQIELLREISATLKRVEASSPPAPIAPAQLTSFERVIPEPPTALVRAPSRTWESMAAAADHRRD